MEQCLGSSTDFVEPGGDRSIGIFIKNIFFFFLILDFRGVSSELQSSLLEHVVIQNEMTLPPSPPGP